MNSGTSADVKGALPSLAKSLAPSMRQSRGLPLILLALGSCWLLFFNALRSEWVINTQYNYGWLVPLLGAALLWRRWPDRPVPAAPLQGGMVYVICAGLLLLPLRILLEANPEWRLLYWSHGLLLLTLSGCLLYRIGGWPWIKWFGFSVAFMLIAVPWPTQFEQFCIQGLMRQVAALTVEIAGWLDIAAVQHGNLI